MAQTAALTARVQAFWLWWEKEARSDVSQKVEAEARKPAEGEDVASESLGCAVLGRGAEPPLFWGLLIWLEPGLSPVTLVHYDATMCLACFVCSVLPVLHFL